MSRSSALRLGFMTLCVLFYCATLSAQTTATVHYHRPSGDYSGWGLHLWGSAIAPAEATTWGSPKMPDGDNSFGKYFQIDLQNPNQAVNFIMHLGNTKDTASDRSFIPAQNAEIWLIQGDATVYTSNPKLYTTATVHYQRPAGDYSGWGLHLWGSAIDPAELTTWPATRTWDGADAFGKIFTINLANSALPINFIVHNNGNKDTAADRAFIPNQNPEIWLVQGDATVYGSNPAAATSVRIHYRRKDGIYSGWGLHLWGNAVDPAELTSWPATKAFAGSDSYGAYADVAISDGTSPVELMVHNNGSQDVGATSFIPDIDGDEVWLAEGSSSVYLSEAAGLAAAARVYTAAARWVTANTIGWQISNGSAYTYVLYTDPDGDISVNGNNITTGSGGSSYNLSYGGNFQDMDPNSEFYQRFAYLKNQGFDKMIVPSLTTQQLTSAIKGHLVIAAYSGSTLVNYTAIQRAGLLDDQFYYGGNDLGLTYNGSVPGLKLWAPTARSVSVHLFATSTGAASQVLPMTENASGVWSISGNSSWTGMYYLYEVEVFNRNNGAVVTNLATDPYSVSLSANSTRSHLIDINSSSLKPTGWDSHTVTNLFPFDAPEDMTIYELHVRDFSVLDSSVPSAMRGTFKAFTQTGSNGMQHLTEMAQAGLTHVHLLPVNDIKSINEDRNDPNRIDLTDNIEDLYPGHAQTGNSILSVLSSLPADSQEQQEIMTDLRSLDGFNWGYDPYHFMVPEGSYSTNPDGATRILEFRELVKSLHGIGLRVIPDVVFNHTFDADIFEQLVPDYYYRLNHVGKIENSSCCPDTASENLMYEKLVVDAVVKWAKIYKVDGFRFDLMGHLTKSTMSEIRSALNALTPASDGVDGASLYLYGEGWDFGSLRWLLPDSSAYQYGVTGTGIGTFNDKFRDSIKGKGQNPSELFVDDAFITDKTTNRDQVIGAMRGTLWDYYGYVSDPQESINYLTAHDKATLWDHLLAKIGSYASLDQMTQIQNVGIGLTTLSQGIPFFHAGIEVLRSKSGDENSYDSGDWFNRLAFDYVSNNWAKGLPPGWQSENLEGWDNWAPLLSTISSPGTGQIDATFTHFKEMLTIRKSSPLFRLRTMSDIQDRVSFPAGIWNSSTNAFDGRLVVMKLSDFQSSDLDPNLEVIWVLVNTSWDTWLNFYDEDVKRSGFQLHSVLQNTANPYLKSWLDGCCTGLARATAFSDHNQGGGKISVPPHSVLVYSAQ